MALLSDSEVADRQTMHTHDVKSARKVVVARHGATVRAGVELSSEESEYEMVGDVASGGISLGEQRLRKLQAMRSALGHMVHRKLSMGYLGWHGLGLQMPALSGQVRFGALRQQRHPDPFLPS